MLRIDLSSTDKEISKIVMDACTPFGGVISVNIYRSPTSYAMVRLNDRQAAAVVASKFGQSTFDGSVLIPLKRK